jgi:FtsP/CotA-like multicopper oxidase with cupredoxin domain
MKYSRRDVVLGLSAGAVAAGLAARPAPGRAVAAADGEVRTIHLEARETTWELAPGKTIAAMAYNGRVPGPEIRAREGERLRVVLKNSLKEPTTIHWHGVDVPNAMDGVPGVTQKPIQPGQTFAYEFAARPAGTRWYHTHFQEHRQMDLGLVAPLIIEPAAPEPTAYDREATLVLDDWVTGTGPVLPPTAEGTADRRGSPGGMMSGMMQGRGMGGMMRGMGRGGGAHEAAYDAMTINGRAYPATEPLRVRRGERLRLRIINASAEHTHVVRLAGHRLAVTHTDGNPLAAPVNVDALPIAPSERYDVIVTADHPGAWSLSCLQPGHAAAGERMAILYDGHERAERVLPGMDLAGLRLWEYGLGRGRDILPTPSGSARSFTLTLSGGMMGNDAWTINGKTYPQTEPLRLAKGDPARIVFRNMSMEAHPMHLHGQSFRVMAVNGTRLPQPIVKDVVDVDGHMGSAVIEFTAHNPGDWFLHCHKPTHMEGGMIALAKVGSGL